MEKNYLDYEGLSHTIEKIDQIKQDIIQVTELPTASEDELDKIYQFTGETTADYTNGYFYKCVSDGAATPTYSWEKIDLGDGTPHWSGTRAEYEAIKDTLEAGTIVNITDDYDDGLEVVDVIESGNTNPVTSNAVAEALVVETGSGTPATNWAGTIYWVKTGHVVQVSVRNLQYTLGGVPATGTVIATGLPKSVLSDEIFIAGNNGDLGGNYVAMTNGGSLIVKNFNNTSVVSHFDSFTYVTSED